MSQQRIAISAPITPEKADDDAASTLDAVGVRVRRGGKCRCGPRAGADDPPHVCDGEFLQRRRRWLSGPQRPRFADYEATFAAWDAGWLPSWNGVDVVYTAFLSHGDLEPRNARDRINLVEPVLNTRGEIVWRDPENFLTEEPENSWAYTEFGGSVPSNNIWTGSDVSDGAASDCACWTNQLAAGENGLVDQLTFGGTTSGCSGGGHFLAIGPPELLTSPGLTQLDPIAATVAGPDDWVFANATSVTWYDLPLADQLDFTATAGAEFTLTKLPSGFRDSEGMPFNGFEVLVGDVPLGIYSGSAEVNFVTLAGGAVGGFTIRGIGAATPPTGFESFPVRLSFASQPTDFTVTPVAPPPAADFNGDGSVDSEDLATWSRRVRRERRRRCRWRWRHRRSRLSRLATPVHRRPRHANRICGSSRARCLYNGPAGRPDCAAHPLGYAGALPRG